jgi:hypothetical protein
MQQKPKSEHLGRLLTLLPSWPSWPLHMTFPILWYNSIWPRNFKAQSKLPNATFELELILLIYMPVQGKTVRLQI